MKTGLVRVAKRWLPPLVMGLAISSSALAAPVISAGSATVNVGSTFTIEVAITAAGDVTSWQFDLGFDPAILQASSVIEGPFMSSFGTTLFGPGLIDNGAGLISLVTDSYVDPAPDPSGSGVLAEIEFTALAAGTSALTLSNVFLDFSDSGFTAANGQACVNPIGGTTCAGQAPEPATLALLAGGLLLLGVRLPGHPGRHDTAARERRQS
jgi:general secretion pathway protein D